MTSMFMEQRPEESGPARAPSSSFHWAEVVQAAPLRIRFDGDTAVLPIAPDTLKAGLAEGDRVWVQVYGRRALILGRGNG